MRFHPRERSLLSARDLITMVLRCLVQIAAAAVLKTIHAASRGKSVMKKPVDLEGACGKTASYHIPSTVSRNQIKLRRL